MTLPCLHLLRVTPLGFFRTKNSSSCSRPNRSTLSMTVSCHLQSSDSVIMEIPCQNGSGVVNRILLNVESHVTSSSLFAYFSSSPSSLTRGAAGSAQFLTPEFWHNFFLIRCNPNRLRIYCSWCYSEVRAKTFYEKFDHLIGHMGRQSWVTQKM